MAKVSVEKGYIHVVKIDKSEIDKIDFAICKDPRETIGNFVSRQKVKPDYICNAGFFNMKNGNTIFNVVEEFSRKSNYQYYKDGIGTKDGINLVYGNVDDGGYKDFVTGYPCLVENNNVLPLTYAKEISYRAARTALGYNDTHVYIVCIDKGNGKPGMSLTELANYMKSIGCKYAVNLDGGGSSRLHGPDNKPINVPSENRAVDSVFCVYLKKVRQNSAVMELARCGIITDTDYWNGVMNGDIKLSTSNLEALMKKMADTLQLCQLDNLYRVQVGAFSKKENAKNMLEDLKDKGFSGYIK